MADTKITFVKFLESKNKKLQDLTPAEIQTVVDEYLALPNGKGMMSVTSHALFNSSNLSQEQFSALRPSDKVIAADSVDMEFFDAALKVISIQNSQSQEKDWLIAESSRLQGESARLQGELAKLNAEKLKFEQDKNQSAEYAKQLEQKRVELNEAIKQFNADREAFGQQLEQYKKDVAALNNARQQLNEERLAFEKGKASGVDLNAVYMTIEQLNAKVRSQDEEIKSLKGKLENEKLLAKREAEAEAEKKYAGKLAATTEENKALKSSGKKKNFGLAALTLALALAVGHGVASGIVKNDRNAENETKIEQLEDENSSLVEENEALKELNNTAHPGTKEYDELVKGVEELVQSGILTQEQVDKYTDEKGNVDLSGFFCDKEYGIVYILNESLGQKSDLLAKAEKDLAEANKTIEGLENSTIVSDLAEYEDSIIEYVNYAYDNGYMSTEDKDLILTANEDGTVDINVDYLFSVDDGYFATTLVNSIENEMKVEALESAVSTAISSIELEIKNENNEYTGATIDDFMYVDTATGFEYLNAQEFSNAMTDHKNRKLEEFWGIYDMLDGIAGDDTLETASEEEKTMFNTYKEAYEGLSETALEVVDNYNNAVADKNRYKELYEEYKEAVDNQITPGGSTSDNQTGTGENAGNVSDGGESTEEDTYGPSEDDTGSGDSSSSGTGGGKKPGQNSNTGENVNG